MGCMSSTPEGDGSAAVSNMGKRGADAPLVGGGDNAPTSAVNIGGDNKRFLKIMKRSVQKLIQTRRFYADLYNKLDTLEETNNFRKNQKTQETAEVFRDLLNSKSSRMTAMPTMPDLKFDPSDPIYDLAFDMQQTLDKIRHKKNPRSHHPIATKIPDMQEDTKVNIEFITTMIEEFKLQRILSMHNVMVILQRAFESFRTLPNIPILKTSPTETVTIVGDLHGQLDDLLWILNGKGPDPSKQIVIFNGDFVDRGPNSVEIVMILFCFRIAYPHCCFLNRGNHESPDMNKDHGFYTEVENKYCPELWNLFNCVFGTLPIASIVQCEKTRAFVVHGGIARKRVTLDVLQRLNRFKKKPEHHTVLQDLLWSDPFDPRSTQDEDIIEQLERENRSPEELLKRPLRFSNRRGAGVCFNQGAAFEFLQENGMHFIFRSHECEDDGYKFWFTNRLYTIFSASNYCGENDNMGAYAVINYNTPPRIIPFRANRAILSSKERFDRLCRTVISKVLVLIVQQRKDIEHILDGFVQESALQKYNEFITVYRKKKAEEAASVMEMKDSRSSDDVAKADAAEERALQEANIARPTLSRVQWARGMMLALNLDVPFLYFASELGLKGDGGDPNLRLPPRVDYKAWLRKFDTSHQLRVSSRLKSNLSLLLFSPESVYSQSLEELFKHFDKDNSGKIDVEEFKEGLLELVASTGSLKDCVTERDINEFLEEIDLNKDGEIEFDEFFKGVAYGSIDLRISDGGAMFTVPGRA